MQFDVWLQEWRTVGVEQLRLSTIDLTGIPSLENLHRGVEFALKHREQGSSVYVHCKAGRSRSATLVAAYLIRVSRLYLHRRFTRQNQFRVLWGKEMHSSAKRFSSLGFIKGEQTSPSQSRLHPPPSHVCLMCHSDKTGLADYSAQHPFGVVTILLCCGEDSSIFLCTWSY